jgi:hypothetical protein
MNEQITAAPDRLDVLFAAEGHHGHHSAAISPTNTVREFIEIAILKTGIEGLLEAYVENGDEPLGHDLLLVEHLSIEFAPLHVAKPGMIETIVRYQGRQVERGFRPAATIEKVTDWAVEKLGLTEDPDDFQLKHNGKVLPPDAHLGQVA